MLNIRFIGICCHIDPRSADDPFKKRVILINANGNGNGNGHNGHAEHARHIPYVAIEAADFLSTSTGETGQKFTVGNTDYLRFDLANEQVIVDPLKADPYTLLDTYTDLVGSMRHVAPAAPQYPRDECFNPALDNGTLIAGYFDIQAGWLMAGDREENVTPFDPPTSGTGVRNAISTNLLVHWGIGDTPVIKLKSIQTGGERRINLRTAVKSITIGNQPQRSIENPQLPLPSSPQDHFGVYYNLLPDENKSIQKPLPARTAPFSNGCQVQNWP